MALSGDLGSLFSSDLPEGRQNLLDSYTNLERVAEYCENNYFQCDNKRQALEETKGYTTQSLASVAYQINTLAYNFLQMLDLQAAQLGEMESQVNHISQTIDIHKEKVARREIGILTANKSSNRQYKIIAPANPERQAKYVRKPIDYSLLDEIGHGVKNPTPPMSSTPRQPRPSHYGPGLMNTSQYAPGISAGSSAYGSLGNVSSNSGPGVGPAPTTKPPTPPQPNRYPNAGGTLTRGSKEYRTPSMVNPPQVPSNYAPNYPQGSRPNSGKQYGTLPHSQMAPHVTGQHEDRYSSGGGSTTMPRLSSSSMRSTGSQSSNSTVDATYARYGVLGRTPQQPQQTYGILKQPSVPAASMNSSISSSQNSQYGTSPMARPNQRPPSPPLPPPPQQMPYQQLANQQQYNPVYSRHQPNDANSSIYSRQSSSGSSVPPQMDIHPNMSTHSLQSLPSQHTPQNPHQIIRQNSAQSQLAAAAAAVQRQLSRQSSQGSVKNPGATNIDVQDKLPVWVPKNYLEKVTAIYDYNADKEDELSFQEGSKIYVLKKNDDGWWEGVMNGITGLFPGNYVEANV